MGGGVGERGGRDGRRTSRVVQIFAGETQTWTSRVSVFAGCSLPRRLRPSASRRDSRSLGRLLAARLFRGRLCSVGGAFGADEEPEAASVAAAAVGSCKVGQTEPSAETLVSGRFLPGATPSTRSS